jgi:triosephosphate isomerase
MRKFIIAGNWKMHLTQGEAKALIAQLRPSADAAPIDVVVCPAFTALAAAAAALQGSTIGLGAQDLFWEPQGAFTGEVSASMLADAGCRYVLIGHSERRTSFGETDQTIAKKLAAALLAHLIPIVCIGETLQERDAHHTWTTLTRQLEGGLHGLTTEAAAGIVLAYEPVWAIGTGKTATPEQAQEAHAFIRQWLSKRFGGAVAERLRIQYGGSVNAGNAGSLLQQPDVDGALVGGASLKAESFHVIISAAVEAHSKAVTR